MIAGCCDRHALRSIWSKQFRSIGESFRVLSYGLKGPYDLISKGSSGPANLISSSNAVSYGNSTREWNRDRRWLGRSNGLSRV